ncbi:activating signal cointegrator 1 complex subunit 2 homolog [Macrobrachium nipponense]|uniref:activating signal cointegrator 1 complex subunit 2 homolog n=1 Tax=Macrobrachium nipponense TaxID=159736 RepID=UPI0030C83BC1
MLINTCYVVIFLAGLACAQQRMAPGVPPTQYQGGQPQHQQPPQQHGQYQASNVQYKQAPGVPPQQYQQQQFQQVPQQVPQQQQYGQPAPPPQQPQQQQFQAPQQTQQAFQQPAAPGQGIHQPHQPHQPHQNQHVLHNPNLSQERDHIKDHLEVPIDTSGMSEQELQYHYFKMHDADNNNKLDGQELIKSLFHWHDAANHEPGKTGHPVPEAKLFTDEELVAMIDPILDQDDKNKDGFIDYPEFVQAQRNAASAAGANSV